MGSLIIYTGSTNYSVILSLKLSNKLQKILFWGFFIAFAIKTPLWPFHIWLPLAHGESNTGGSVILASILLKLGLYGMLRFLIPLFPFALYFYKPYILILCVLGVSYSVFSALSLVDIKSVIVYSSITHMNLGMVGIISNNCNGLVGTIIYSISHS
jgi:NADH:ubiquinone oxidoreductase subunit 4 (subunit M)